MNAATAADDRMNRTLRRIECTEPPSAFAAAIFFVASGAIPDVAKLYHQFLPMGIKIPASGILDEATVE
jgi:hypothetical protein